MLVVWWLKPLYDRVVLHVLSRAVFGEAAARPRGACAPSANGSAPACLVALTLRPLRPARARSTCRCASSRASRGREARERRARARPPRRAAMRSWLTVVCIALRGRRALDRARRARRAAPAGARPSEGTAAVEHAVRAAPSSCCSADLGRATRSAIRRGDPAARAVLRRRRLRRSTSTAARSSRAGTSRSRCAASPSGMPQRCSSLCLRGPLRSLCRAGATPRRRIPKTGNRRSAEGEGVRLLPGSRCAGSRATRAQAEGAAGARPDVAGAPSATRSRRRPRCCCGSRAGALIAYALWWAGAHAAARRASRRREPYRPPPALFGMDLAPEKLPPDVAAAAAALAREGRLREALGLLYRGALSELVHKRGVQLLASHTEGEAVRLAGHALLRARWSTRGSAARTRAACRRRTKSSGSRDGLPGGVRMKTRIIVARPARRWSRSRVDLVSLHLRARAGAGMGRPLRRGAAAPVPRRASASPSAWG